MQCLYCGKGIGPIRQLRDLEFCSDVHRKQFRERYRSRLLEALAPDPAPAEPAGFIEQRANTAIPVPYSDLRPIPIVAAERFLPPLRVQTAGLVLEEAGWTPLRSSTAATARPVCDESVAPFPPAIQPAVFSVAIRPPNPSEGAAASPYLAPKAPAQRAAAAAPRLATPTVAPRNAVSLTHADRTFRPLTEFAATQVRVAVPPPAELAAVGAVEPTIHAVLTVKPSAAIAIPAAPPGKEPAAEQPRLSAAAAPLIRYQLSTAASEPLPVAFEALVGHTSRTVMKPALRPPELASLARLTDPQPAPLAASAPSWPTDRALSLSNEPAYPRVNSAAAPIGAPADLLQRGSLLVHEAVGHQDPHAVPAPLAARLDVIAAPHEFTALLGALPSAPLNDAGLPQPSAPPEVVSLSNDAASTPAERPLVPLANVTLPLIPISPSSAGALTQPGEPLEPAIARAVRSTAVLWTLRVPHVCGPVFAIDPIRVRFNDLLRANRAFPYLGDGEESPASKSNLRAFKRYAAVPLRRQKWVYAGLAAAALLVAGLVAPQMALKRFGGTSISWSNTSIRQWITSRATRTFQDDFRGGLDQWKSLQAKMPKSWSYSADGFIHPGQLAFYRPSAPLSDYRLEFMAQIENKSVDWVVRAHDQNNYYAMKFTVLQPGPRPIVAMVRYPVIEGARGARVQTPVRMMVHANTPYRVTVDVKGNRYRTYIEGQEADFWTDDRLKTGGVGFFSEAGERARLYWVKVESQGDLLGRICGLLSGKSSEGATDKEKQAMDYRHAGTADGAAPGVNGAEAAVKATQETRISRVLSRAASLHLDGKREEAARELVRALDGGDRHPALYFALGQLQYELGEYLPASQSYGQAALLQPQHPTAHFNTGVCLGRLERWDEAAESFKKAISNDPARLEAHLALGACLVQMGRHNEALDAYDRFLARHPEHDEALFGKAVALQKRDRAAEAVELYRRILNRNPNSEEALSNLVSLSLANQDYEQVRKYAQRLADVQPKSQIALEGLAGAAFAAGDHQAAAIYSRKLAELAPDVFENWFNLGVACHKAGDLPNAASAYARATKVQPDSPQAHLNLGVALQEQGDLKAARTAYERALAIDSKLAGVHWNLGLVHEQLGDLEAAEELYTQVPEGSPDSEDATFRIGHLRLQRADYAGSIQAFEACLRKRPVWPEARLNLGIAHWRLGDKDAARACFQELTASGADSKEALRGLAALSLEHQDYDQAFDIYRQLLDSGERTPELLYNAGLICQRRGQPEDAAVLYREALKGDPQFGEALLNLGHALMSLGHEFEARSCWRKAVMAKPELAQRYFEPAQAS